MVRDDYLIFLCLVVGAVPRCEGNESVSLVAGVEETAICEHRSGAERGICAADPYYLDGRVNVLVEVRA